jgi:hypothetical protein
MVVLGCFSVGYGREGEAFGRGMLGWIRRSLAECLAPTMGDALRDG